MATRTLEDWLAYIERQHPQDIALGLDRVLVFGSFHTVAAAMTSLGSEEGGGRGL